VEQANPQTATARAAKTRRRIPSERDRHFFGFCQSQSKQDKVAHRLIRRLTRRNLYTGATFNGRRRYVEVRYLDPRLTLSDIFSKAIEILLDGSMRRVGR
jgi:hypothetical protein